MVSYVFPECDADTQFECAVSWNYGELQCVSNDYYCDGERDCDNVDDEADCDERRNLESKKSRNVDIVM